MSTDRGARPGLAVILTAIVLHTQLAFAAGCDLPMFAGARLFASAGSVRYMAIADLNGDGFMDVVVTNSVVSVLMGAGDGTFRPAVNYPATNPSFVVIADFNGDGKLDLAVNANGGIQFMAGNGDGRFLPGIGASSQGGAMAVGDFNGDGKPDLAVSGIPAYILLGKGDGTFQAPISPDGPFAAGFGIAVGDFNGDGKLDAIAGTAGGVFVMLGDGKGNLAAPVTVSTGTGFAPMQFAVGDFNGDHKLDVAALSTLDAKVSVLLGNGNGTFQAAINYDSGTLSALANSLIVADLNGDGAPDLAVAGQASLVNLGAILVLTGNGDGTFQTAVQYNPTGQPGSALAAGDFNSDGLPDLVFASSVSTPTQVGVMFGKADGTFQTPPSFPVGPIPRSPVLADFNGDGVLDLVVANAGINGNLSVLIGNGDGSFQPAVRYPTALGAQSVAVGDFNGDGKADMAVANGASGNILVFLGNGDGTFQTPRASGSLGGAFSIAAGDFNNDGKLDVAMMGAGGIQIVLGAGDGTFRQSFATYGSFALGSGRGIIAVADLNGDGKLDLVVPNSNLDSSSSLRPGAVSVLLGNGDATFKTNVDYDIGTRATSVAIGDLNGDGRPDLAVSDLGAGTVAVLLGNGDGTFQAAIKYPVGRGATFVAMGDLNGDGFTDLAVGNFPGSSVTILLGNGDATFRNALTYGTAADPASAAIGDLNGDGQPDLAIVDDTSNSVLVLLNTYVAGAGSVCAPVASLGR